MLTKTYSDGGSRCRVTFHVLPEIRAKTAHLCGDFNNWSTRAHPMERQTDGSFLLTLELSADHDYR